MDNCPGCHVSLIGEPVPARHLKHYTDDNPDWNRNTDESHDAQIARFGRCYCLPWGEITHFRREILVEIQGVYDGGLFFQCPDCGHRWHRWPVGTSLHDKAVPYVEQGRSLDG